MNKVKLDFHFSVTVDYDRIMSPEQWRKALGKSDFDAVQEYEMLEYLSNNSAIPEDLEMMVKFAKRIQCAEDFEYHDAELDFHVWGYQDAK